MGMTWSGVRVKGIESIGLGSIRWVVVTDRLGDVSVRVGGERGDPAMSVTTYVIVLLVASFLGTVWMTTDAIDSAVTVLLVWSGPAALASILSRGGRNYFVWPSILWMVLVSALWIGAAENVSSDNQDAELSVRIPVSAEASSAEPGRVYVVVGRESSEGFSQDALTVEALPRIEARSLEIMRRHVCNEIESSGKRCDPKTLEAESVIVELGRRKLAVTKFKLKGFDFAVAAQFVGIIDGELVRVGCVTDKLGGLVLNKGVCNDKIKEVFGVSLRPNE
jgi:hypothetical protein